MIAIGQVGRFLRVAALFVAVVGLCAANSASAADYAPSDSEIADRMSFLINDSPGSALVFAGCKAVAEEEYRKTGKISDGLSAITICAGVGCTLTRNYSNCVSVVSELFVLRVLLEAG